MLISFLRATILYFVVVVAIRLMGKRQIGELQPSELVITILISDVATIPLQDNSMPLLTAIIPLMTLICFEIFLSVLNMKSITIRNAFSGKAVVVIKDGKINQRKLKSLRFTIDDLLATLRQKDVFDISEVDTAIVETNGNLSVLKKADKQTLTAEMISLKPDDKGIPQVLISDGKIIKENIGVYGITLKDIEKELKRKRVDLESVFLMTGYRTKEFTVIKSKDDKG